MVKKVLLLVTLLLIPSIYALDPIPPGTQAGTLYVRVVDCVSKNPIVGASVNLDNPTHRVSEITNTTGYAELYAFEWFYTYYVTAPGYRIEAGERRFFIGEVFHICLFPESAGFWRIVASIQMWQGDIHAGGLGWAIIRLKNLEPGAFNITEFQIWVSGYDGPAVVYSTPNGVLLGRLVEREINITVSPKPDVPVGRLKAELRLRTTFTSVDGRVEGPFTVSTDLDYITIAPFRSFNVRIIDHWGNNPVPDATLILEPTLPGVESKYMFKSDEGGYITFRRVSDGAYRLRVFYPSPYDGEVYMVRQVFPILVDLAKLGKINTFLYEAHVNIVDLANRALDAKVKLGNVEAVAVNGSAVFKNVPKGRYEIKCWWKEVEVCGGNISVDEPLVRNSPGGRLDIKADVGDLILDIRNYKGENLRNKVKLTITPFGDIQEAVDKVVFSRLPRGDYNMTAYAYNWIKEKEFVAGFFRFTIPKDHGEHIVKLDVFDAVVNLVDIDGKPAPFREAFVEGKKVDVHDGKIVLKEITYGQYFLEAEWFGFTVLRQNTTLTPEANTVAVGIYTMKVAFAGVDGSPVNDATAILKIGAANQTKQVVNASALFELVPEGIHQLIVIMNGVKIFEGLLETESRVSITVNAGLIKMMFKDQHGNPVAGVEVEVMDVGKGRAGPDGSASLGQAPFAEYRYRARYKGFALFDGLVKPGQTLNLTIPLYTLKTEVVNELDIPTEAVIELIRDGNLLERRTGSETYFTGLPPGPYILRASIGAKQVEQQAILQTDGQVVRVKMPIILVIGSVLLSTSELMTILSPLVAFSIAIVSAVILRKTIRGKGKKTKGRVLWASSKGF